MAGAHHGGAEAFFERLAAALARAGVHQHLAIRKNPARRARLRKLDTELSEHSFGGRMDFWTSWQLRRVAAQFRPDVTLAWMSRAAIMAPKRYGVTVARLGGYYNTKYYRGFDHLIGNTQSLCDYLVQQGWPRERVHCLPNFVDAKPLPPEPREAHDTPEDAPLLLAAGRLHWRKGFDVLLAALETIPDAVLWLAGSGPEEDELRRLAEAMGVADRVRWLGWRQDMAALYRACDLFVCPSRQEPLGNVVIEALAHGVPVIATDTAGPSTLIQHGETGLLVPVEDYGALASAIETLLSDPASAAAMKAAGEAVYRASFTEEAVVGRYLEFFERVRG